LSFIKCGIILGLTRETTRSSQSRRLDRAHVLTTGCPSTTTRRPQPPGCPSLLPGREYVCFNGNGKHGHHGYRGHGYRLIGKTQRGWLSRCGYPIPQDEPGQWRSIRRFLTDLHQISSPFGLIASGWHSARKEWVPLEEGLTFIRTASGRRWLGNCVLRVYSEADYLVRWRAYFAQRLGFSVIPGSLEAGDSQDVTASPDVLIDSAHALDRWMLRQRITDQQLADKLGVSRSLVSRYRAERRPWSKAFQERIAAALAADENSAQEPGTAP
jgi:Helix-turn-helix domain